MKAPIREAWEGTLCHLLLGIDRFAGDGVSAKLAPAQYLFSLLITAKDACQPPPRHSYPLLQRDIGAVSWASPRLLSPHPYTSS